MSEPEITCEKAGCCGLITLNRPKALNALTLNMVREMAGALDRWERDPAVTRVIVMGAGGKAFCAGGDIRILYDLGKAGRHAEQLSFWREEYCLNHRIKLYPKPYVALADGIVMGGGAGISVHGSHVVAGEHFTFAMPETGIGFFPDVGATFFLPRLPGHAGVYLALTGACDDLWRRARLWSSLRPCSVGAARGARAKADRRRGHRGRDRAPKARRRPPRRSIRKASLSSTVFPPRRFLPFSPTSTMQAGPAWTSRVPLLMRYAPNRRRALQSALRQMQIGAKLDIGEALRTEFRIVSRIARGHDFYEGVRAVIIDKDNRPRWNPAGMDSVEPAAHRGVFCASS